MDAETVAARKADELTGGNAFAVFNHLEVEHVEPDYAVFKLDIRPESKNPRGFVHGGLLAGMADNAAGYARPSNPCRYLICYYSRLTNHCTKSFQIKLQAQAKFMPVMLGLLNHRGCISLYAVFCRFQIHIRSSS